jgi:hypothetical protein
MKRVILVTIIILCAISSCKKDPVLLGYFNYPKLRIKMFSGKLENPNDIKFHFGNSDIYVSEYDIISPREIKTYEISKDNKNIFLRIELINSGAELLYHYSSENIGKYYCLILNDQIIAVNKITTKIKTNELFFKYMIENDIIREMLER